MAQIDTAVFPVQKLQWLAWRQAVAITVKTGLPFIERARGNRHFWFAR